MKKYIKITMIPICVFILFQAISIFDVSAEGENKAVITFIDDDNKSMFLNVQKPIFDKYKIKTTLAVITDFVGTPNYLTKEELLELQNEGFEIISHTDTHSKSVFKSADTDLSNVTDEQIETEFRDSQLWLKNNGFKGYDTVVYPWGDFENETERYIKLASQYYKCGVNANSYSDSKNNMYLNRLFLNKDKPIKNYKKAVDEVVKNNGWLIIGTHSTEAEISSNYLEEFIRYAESKNVEFLTFTEASKLDLDYMYTEEMSLLNKRSMLIAVGIVAITLIITYSLKKNKYKYRAVGQ